MAPAVSRPPTAMTATSAATTAWYERRGGVAWGQRSDGPRDRRSEPDGTNESGRCDACDDARALTLRLQVERADVTRPEDRDRPAVERGDPVDAEPLRHRHEGGVGETRSVLASRLEELQRPDEVALRSVRRGGSRHWRWTGRAPASHPRRARAGRACRVPPGSAHSGTAARRRGRTTRPPRSG